MVRGEQQGFEGAEADFLRRDRAVAAGGRLGVGGGTCPGKPIAQNDVSCPAAPSGDRRPAGSGVRPKSRMRRTRAIPEPAEELKSLALLKARPPN